MIRTQIYLPELMHVYLKTLAKKEDKTMSEIIREKIEESSDRDFEEKEKKNLFEVLDELSTKEGPSDLSEKMDYYLYGDGRK